MNTRNDEQRGPHPDIREIPGLLIAIDDEWAVNIGLIAWQRGPIGLPDVRRQLRDEGRRLKQIAGREFVRMLPGEVLTYYSIARYWSFRLAKLPRGGM